MGIRTHRTARLTTPVGHKEMTAAGLAGLMTQSERSQLRGAAMDVRDLKEELARPYQVNRKGIKRLMLASGIFDQARIDELFS